MSIKNLSPRKRRRALRRLIATTLIALSAGATAVYLYLRGANVSLADSEFSLGSCVAQELGVDEDSTVTERELKSLTHLECDPAHSDIRSVNGIELLPNLTSLTLTGYESITLDAIVDAPALTSLSLNWTRIPDSQLLASIEHLESLTLNSGCQSSRPSVNLDALSESTTLESLSLRCISMDSLGFLSSFPHLESLELSHIPNTTLGVVARIPSLESLVVSGSTAQDLSPLVDVPSLKSLRVEDSSLSDLSPLSEIPSLTQIALVRTEVSDLNPLSELPNLTSVTLRENDSLRQVGVLLNCPDLTEVNLAGSYYIYDDSDLYEADWLDVTGPWES